MVHKPRHVEDWKGQETLHALAGEWGAWVALSIPQP